MSLRRTHARTARAQLRSYTGRTCVRDSPLFVAVRGRRLQSAAAPAAPARRTRGTRRERNPGSARSRPTCRRWPPTTWKDARRRRAAADAPRSTSPTQLKAMGVEPGGENGTYFQQVPIVESAVNRNFMLSVPGRTYRYFDDIVAFSGTEQARVHVQGDVVFVGHGIVAPELKWNDYEGANVKGKWVLVMVNDPPAPAGRAEPVRRQGADLLRPLDLQVRRSRAPGCGRRHPDSHRRISDLSVAGRPVVVERHAVLAASRGRCSRARHQGVDEERRRRRPGEARRQPISINCARRRSSADSRPCR